MNAPLGFVVVPSAIAGALSGLALVVLALAVLRLPPRSFESMSFGALSACWGFAVTAANVSTMSDDIATARALGWATFLFYLVMLAPVALFASALGLGKPARKRSFVIAILAAVAVLALVAILRPTWVIEDISIAPNGRASLVAGALYHPIVSGSNVLSIAGVLGVVAYRLHQTPRGSEEAARVGALGASLVAYIAYRASQDTTILVAFRELLAELGFPIWLLVASAVLSLGATLALLGVMLARPEQPWRVPAFALALAGGFIGALEGFGAVASSSVGVWRIVMVGLLAYTLARYRLFDLELRLAAFAPIAVYLATAALAIFAFWSSFRARLLDAPLLGGVATIGVALATVPVMRVGALAIRRAAPHLSEDEYLYKRKIDVYRSALEEVQLRGAGEKTEVLFLTDLRKRLGISEAEHRVLMLVLRGQDRYAASARGSKSAKFRIERELGRGSYGRALLAHDVMLDRQVVLKQPLAAWLLDPAGREEFLRESRLAARIDHPNVVRVYGVETDEDPPVLVMEYVEGGSLAALLEREPRLDATRATQIAADILRGLEQIHDVGIVHRDLKPANVLLGARGAKISDFGVARAYEDIGRTIGADGGQPGSIAYMSPEQARGADVGPRSDIYSVGVILYRMLAGAHYFGLKGLDEARGRQLVETAAPDLSVLPERFRPVLSRALAKEAAERYASAAEMLAALPLETSTARESRSLRG